MMKRSYRWTIALGMLAWAPGAQAQNWDGMLDRLTDRVGQNVEDRVGGVSDKAVNKAFDKTEEQMDCATGDPNCVPPAKQDAAGTRAAPASSAKCVATDVGCLKTAKAQGLTVEIVEEEELDVMRCASTDTKCLKRAKQLGKPVEITD